MSAVYCCPECGVQGDRIFLGDSLFCRNCGVATHVSELIDVLDLRGSGPLGVGEFKFGSRNGLTVRFYDKSSAAVGGDF